MGRWWRPLHLESACGLLPASGPTISSESQRFPGGLSAPNLWQKPRTRWTNVLFGLVSLWGTGRSALPNQHRRTAADYWPRAQTIMDEFSGERNLLLHSYLDRVQAQALALGSVPWHHQHLWGKWLAAEAAQRDSRWGDLDGAQR